MRRAEAAAHVLHVLCKLYFLVDGRYPTLRMLLLGLQFGYDRPGAAGWSTHARGLMRGAGPLPSDWALRLRQARRARSTSS